MGAGCWWEASGPLHSGDDTGLLECPGDMVAASPRVSNPREQGRSSNVIYWQLHTITSAVFC